MKSLQFLSGTFDLNLGKFSLPIAYWQAGSIVFLIFLLIVTLAQFRRHYVDWSLKGTVVGIFLGFLLALFLEGFLVIGGRTAVTELLGWKNPPLPIARALDAGKSKLVQILGTQTEVPSTYAKENTTVQNALEVVQSLNPQDLKSVRSVLCSP